MDSAHERNERKDDISNIEINKSEEDVSENNEEGEEGLGEREEEMD